MKAEFLTKEMKEEILATYAEYLPTERMKAADFDNCKEAEDYDEIVLAQGQDRDYKISYWDKDYKELKILFGNI